MNGPEHYAKAERLLAAANRSFSSPMGLTVPAYESEVLAAAQVHAMLATAAAIVDAAEGQPALPQGHNGTVAMQPEWDAVTT